MDETQQILNGLEQVYAACVSKLSELRDDRGIWRDADDVHVTLVGRIVGDALDVVDKLSARLTELQAEATVSAQRLATDPLLKLSPDVAVQAASLVGPMRELLVTADAATLAAHVEEIQASVARTPHKYAVLRVARERLGSGAAHENAAHGYLARVYNQGRGDGPARTQHVPVTGSAADMQRLVSAVETLERDVMGADLVKLAAAADRATRAENGQVTAAVTSRRIEEARQDAMRRPDPRVIEAANRHGEMMRQAGAVFIPRGGRRPS